MAEEQRGEPENMGGGMMHNPNLFPNGTGFYTHATEHVGDLTNRMAADWATGREGDGSFGYRFVKEKVNRVLDHLNRTYGFEREVREQVERNYHYYVRNHGADHSLKEWWTDLEEAGNRYSEAHSKLVVYNEAQWFARQAAIDIGHMDFSKCRQKLEALDEHLHDEDAWVAYASRVRINNLSCVPFND